MSAEQSFRSFSESINPNLVWSHLFSINNHPLFTQNVRMGKMEQARDELAQYCDILTRNYITPNNYSDPYHRYFNHKWGKNFIATVSPKKIADVLADGPHTPKEYHDKQKEFFVSLNGDCFKDGLFPDYDKAKVWWQEYRKSKTTSPKENTEVIIQLIKETAATEVFRSNAIDTLCYLHGARDSMVLPQSDAQRSWMRYYKYSIFSSNILYTGKPMHTTEYYESRNLQNSSTLSKLRNLATKSGVSIPSDQESYLDAAAKVFELRHHQDKMRWPSLDKMSGSYRLSMTDMLHKQLYAQFGAIPELSDGSTQVANEMLAQINDELKYELFDNIACETGTVAPEIARRVIEQYRPGYQRISESLKQMGPLK
jgi:hypothetical protein